MKEVYEEFKTMHEDNIIFSYNGSLNGELIASLLQLSDSKLKELDIPLKRKKNVINILIECLQNILYHTDGLEGDEKDCLLLIGVEDDDIVLIAGNQALASKTLKLKEKLKKIKSLSAPELHEYYLETLDSGLLSDKGGAGLGMIRMFREAEGNVDYTFKEIENGKEFFSLEIRVPRDFNKN